MRAGGYLLVWALLLVKVGLRQFTGTPFEHFQVTGQTFSTSTMVGSAIGGSVITFVLLVTYAVTILAVTARRSAVAPVPLAIGSSLGVTVGVMVYALAPLGSFLRIDNSGLHAGSVLLFVVMVVGVPILAELLAAPGSHVAGVLTGTVAALVVTNLTIITMLLMPRGGPGHLVRQRAHRGPRHPAGGPDQRDRNRRPVPRRAPAGPADRPALQRSRVDHRRAGARAGTGPGTRLRQKRCGTTANTTKDDQGASKRRQRLGSRRRKGARRKQLGCKASKG